jgi:hypothetical protein
MYWDGHWGTISYPASAGYHWSPKDFAKARWAWARLAAYPTNPLVSAHTGSKKRWDTHTDYASHLLFIAYAHPPGTLPSHMCSPSSRSPIFTMETPITPSIRDVVVSHVVCCSQGSVASYVSRVSISPTNGPPSPSLLYTPPLVWSHMHLAKTNLERSCHNLFHGARDE